MEKSDIGMIGLGVMGAALAENMESKGYRVSVYDRIVPGETPAADRFMRERGAGRNFEGFHELERFVASVKRPRRIMLMIRAGAPVDETTARLLPLLDSGTVSVFALNDQVDGLFEEGMLYAFDSPQLTNRSTRGLSNELIGRPARVHIAQGTLIVFCPLV